MARLPDHVILVMTEGSWDAAAFPGDHPNLAAEAVSEAERRKAAGATVHVWHVPLQDATEVEAVPSHQVPASLEPKA